MTYWELPLTKDGESDRIFTLNGNSYHFVTRFNYTAQCWVLDIRDAVGTGVASGIMLVPGVNLLGAYPALRTAINGDLQVFEYSPGEYSNEQGLGVTCKLVWVTV